MTAELEEPRPVRIVIEASVPAWVLPTMFEGVRNITPVDGHFRFEYGSER